MENNFIDMLDDMPQELSDIEKLRWIYIKVCLKFSYDLEYWSKPDKAKSIFYKNIDDIIDIKLFVQLLVKYLRDCLKKQDLM